MTANQFVTIVVIMIALGASCLAVFVVSACVQSGNDAEFERRINALRALGQQEYPADDKSDYA